MCEGGTNTGFRGAGRAGFLEREGGEMGDKLVNVKADTIEDFLEKAIAAIGGDAGEIGDCSYKPTYKASYDKDKKITKISFDIEIEVRRAHWAGGSKVDKRHEKAIKLAESLNEGHEEKHRKLAETLSDKAFSAAKKSLVGKTAKDADEVIKDLTKSIKKAFDDLDKKEGMVDFDDDEAKDVIVVRLKGA